LGPLKSGIPQEVDIPAPVMATHHLLSVINLARVSHLPKLKIKFKNK